MTNAQQQPRLYQLRVFAGDVEIFVSRRYVAILDLSPGAGLRTAKNELDALLYRLATLDAVDADITNYRLLVTDVTTADKFDWPMR